jgi:predicted permease
MFADLKYAVRQLIKSPGFTVVALITLALGVGVNTSMFTLLNAVTLSESSAYDSARLVSIFRTSPQSQSWPHSPADLRDLERQSSSFRTTAGFTYSNVNLAEPGQPAERLHGMAVSSEFFPLFGVSPALGRTFTAEEDRAGAGRVAVISDGLWRTRFAADPGVVGRTVRMDAQPTTIIGVMPGRFADPLYWGHVDLWVPLAYDSATWQVRDNHWLSAIGRLKDGVSLAQAQAEGSAIATRLEHEHPDTNAQSGIRLAFWNDVRIADVSRRITWLCMGLSGFVLLIACANLANLQLARAAAKAHEHALRVALGASRLRLMRQFLVESLLLSLAGGALGVLVASWGTRLMGAQIVIGDVPGLDLPVNMRVLAFSLVVAVATGIGFGTVPAWIASRADLGLALKQSGRGATGGRSRHRIRQALIVSELVLALVLMSGAAFFVRGMQRISRSDMGWRPEHLVIAGLTLPFNPSYATDEQCRAFYDRLEAKLSELPGVESAAVSATLPITGFWSSSNFAVEGRPPPQKGREPLAYFNPASPGYFKTLGIRIVKGRDFNATDRASSRAVVVINEGREALAWRGRGRQADREPGSRRPQLGGGDRRRRGPKAPHRNRAPGRHALPGLSSPGADAFARGALPEHICPDLRALFDIGARLAPGGGVHRPGPAGVLALHRRGGHSAVHELV